MPESIQLNTVQDLNINDFKNQETGTLQDGKIKLGGSTYSVKFTDGKVSVSRNFSFLNFLRHNAKNDLKDAFKSQMYDIRKGKNEALYTNTFKALEKNFHEKGAQNVLVFGMYGQGTQGEEAIEKFVNHETAPEKDVDANNPMKDNKAYKEWQARTGNLPQEKHSIKATGIETFIGAAGLNPFRLSRETFMETLQSVENLEGLMNRAENLEDARIDKTLFTAWTNHLHKNADKVNIFTLLAKADAESQNQAIPTNKLSGWSAMIRKHGLDETIQAFMCKNGWRKPLPKEFFKEFRGILNMQRLHLENPGKRSAPSSVDLRNALENSFGGWRSGQAQEALTCLGNAVQRELMKLGLDFCRDQKIPVVFQWTNAEGKTVSAKELKRESWNPEHNQDKHPKFSPILQTAMRHAQRLQHVNGEKLNLIQVNGADPEG